jgi:hypothetical protein
MNAFGEEQPKGNVHGPLALCVSHCNRLWMLSGLSPAVLSSFKAQPGARRREGS